MDNIKCSNCKKEYDNNEQFIKKNGKSLFKCCTVCRTKDKKNKEKNKNKNNYAPSNIYKLLAENIMQELDKSENGEIVFKVGRKLEFNRINN